MTATLLDTFTPDELSDGFTYDPTTDQLLTVGSRTGWAIAVPGTEHEVGDLGTSREAFAAAFADVITAYGDQIANGAVIGGWYSPAREVYLVELTEIHDVDDATAYALGVARGQEGIFCLTDGRYVETGGLGDAAA